MLYSNKNSYFLTILLATLLGALLFLTVGCFEGTSTDTETETDVTYYGGDDPASAYAITPNDTTPINGEITDGSDADWFRIQVTASTTYTASVDLGTLPGAIVTVYDTDGVTVLATSAASSVQASFSTGGDHDVTVTYEATHDGENYIVVEGEDDDYGTYTVEVDDDDGDDDDDDDDGYTENEGDCDDTDDDIHPGAVEICGDGIDQDCSGADADDCDSDGYSVAEGDCDDTDASIHPGAVETCGDTIDQDCSGADADDCDSDGYSVAGGDCDDTDASVHPGAAEICGDTVDQDCNGTDLTCPPENTYYRDADGDGYGDPNDSIITTDTTPPDGYVTDNTDFDDTDATSYPGATERCDSVDNNGDAQIDEGCTTYYEDSDGDGYGNASVSVVDTSQPAGYVTDSTDCDDIDATVNPGAAELCGDGIDNNCDVQIDEGCPPVILNIETTSWVSPRLAVDSYGILHIVYVDTGITQFRYRTWNGTLSLPQDSSLTVIGGYNIACSPIDNTAYVSFNTSATWGSWGDLLTGKITSTGWEPFVTQVTGTFGYITSIDIDSDGYMHISFREEFDVGLRYWTDRPDLQVAVGVVDLNSNPGRYSTIQIDSSNLPHIAYSSWGGSNPEMRYAYWNGSTWQVETPCTPTGTFRHVSLALDSLDQPHISYHDSLSNTTRYAFKDGAGWYCGAVTSPESRYTNIAVDSSDTPYIVANKKLYRRTGVSSPYTWEELDFGATTDATVSQSGKYFQIAPDDTIYIIFTDSEGIKLSIIKK